MRPVFLAPIEAWSPFRDWERSLTRGFKNKSTKFGIGIGIEILDFGISDWNSVSEYSTSPHNLSPHNLPFTKNKVQKRSLYKDSFKPVSICSWGNFAQAFFKQASASALFL